MTPKQLNPNFFQEMPNSERSCQSTVGGISVQSTVIEDKNTNLLKNHVFNLVEDMLRFLH